MKNLASSLLARHLPLDTAVVTFDDGYADNLFNAKPLLERYDTPATVFVTTGAIDRTSEFWWDALDDLLLGSHPLPPSLELKIRGISYQWNLNTSVQKNATRSVAQLRWRAWETPPTARHALYAELWRLLRHMSEEERNQVVERLRAWSGLVADPRPRRRALTTAELIALAEGGIIEIGAHSVTHTSLPTVSSSLRERELHQSKAFLENRLGRTVEAFAYPHGEYDNDSVYAVSRAGFLCACTTSEGVVRRSTDVLRLPRIHVKNWDRQEFERRLVARFVIQ